MNARLQETAVFRPMYLADIEAVVAIECEIYPFPWTYGNFRDSFNAGYSVWVCEFGGTVIGYSVMMVAADEAHLLNLGIARDWQGRGLGRRFLHHLIDLARGYHAGILLLEVRPSNIGARRLYATTGFREIAVRRKYYPAENGREDALLLELVL
ncbi:MAG TPA: ribosomal protein S18-alanine N-acetyltransferase [Sulfuricella sp.]|nr:ribosomal protein S18-alanine N-acetyltransferase [Sulfuricella sp.]